MSQFQTFLSVTLELQNVAAGFALTFFQRVQQFFQFSHGRLRFALCLGLTGGSGVLQFGTRLVQFFLRLATLFFKLREQFFSISQRLGAGVFKMFEQAARQLL